MFAFTFETLPSKMASSPVPGTTPPTQFVEVDQSLSVAPVHVIDAASTCLVRENGLKRNTKIRDRVREY